MALRWTSKANLDLARLHAFLAPVNPAAAAATVELLLAGVRRIAAHPRLGARLTEFSPREVRRLVVGDYEVRYELRDDDLFVLRLWHVREER
jgi:plasmid stabilization system protein ParE